MTTPTLTKEELERIHSEAYEYGKHGYSDTKEYHQDICATAFIYKEAATSERLKCKKEINAISKEYCHLELVELIQTYPKFFGLKLGERGVPAIIKYLREQIEQSKSKAKGGE